jgi:hypothetical protein
MVKPKRTTKAVRDDRAGQLISMFRRRLWVECGRSARPWLERSERVESGYSMTSSAQALIDGGIVRLSAWAVFKLTTKSNLTGCWPWCP